MDKLIDIVIPVIKKHIRVPQGAARLIYQLNYRGLTTREVTWEEPLRIKLESFQLFHKYMESWRYSKKPGIKKLYNFMSNYLTYELIVPDPAKYGCELFEVTMFIPQHKIDEFTQIFFAAHQSDEKQFLTLVK